MDLSQFKATLTAGNPPSNLAHPLQALWYDAMGDWQTAHKHAQAQDDATGAWVHAYLHRKEGDVANARYWYRRARQPLPTITPDAEWNLIAAALLAHGT